MSKLTESLRTIKVYNAHAFYNGDDPSGQVFLARRARTNPRDVVPSAWMVYRVGHKTDPDGPWYYNSNKAFSYVTRESAKKAFAEAQEWAEKRYGIKEWKRDPYGSYGDAEFVTARIKELTQQVKENIATKEDQDA